MFAKINENFLNVSTHLMSTNKIQDDNAKSKFFVAKIL